MSKKQVIDFCELHGVDTEYGMKVYEIIKGLRSELHMLEIEKPLPGESGYFVIKTYLQERE